MTSRVLLLALVVCGAMAAQERADLASRTFELDVLYLGNAGSERARDYARFLEEHFSSVRVANRDDFDPASAAGADVVLLDWSQRDVDLQRMAEVRSPLGERAAWTKPTVLLGSAGLLIAAPWRTTGSYG